MKNPESLLEFLEYVPPLIMDWIASVAPHLADITSVNIERDFLDGGVDTFGRVKKVPGMHFTYTVRLQNGQEYTQVFKKRGPGEWEKV